MAHNSKQPNLFSAITIGVGTIIGSGWLFASYYASKFAGPIALLSWVFGAVIALILAFLLAEVTTVYQERGLFSRLLTLTHNRDYGFIIAISNWLAMVIVIPSEAEATIQYVSTLFPNVEQYIFVHEALTPLGIMCVCALISVYGFVNYWGMKSLTATNNIISSIKLFVPIATALTFLIASFHPQNFTSYHNTIAPYGIGKAFSAIVSCGIFYAFYGFSMIAIFAKDLKNPQRNVPIALVTSVMLCLIIYLLLQTAFIGAITPATILHGGWHSLNFTSPLAQLSALLGLNWLALVLYADAALSPSGTAIIYTGSGAHTLTGMAEDKQLPKLFAHVHPTYFISRSALFVTLFICFTLVTFFANWQKIMIVVSVFQIISCVAIPISFTKLRNSHEPHRKRSFHLPCGKLLSMAGFILVTYLLTQCGVEALVLSLVAHIIFFILYCFAFYKFKLKYTINAFRSSWSMFAYIVFATVFGYLQEINLLNTPIVLSIFLILNIICFYIMLNQKNYNPEHIG